MTIDWTRLDREPLQLPQPAQKPRRREHLGNRNHPEPHQPGPGVEIPICETCGQRHVTAAGKQACKEHLRGSRHRQPVPCRQHPTPGTSVCATHGGRIVKAQHPEIPTRAQRRRQQRNAAQHYAQTYGLPVDISPEEALLREVQFTQGHVLWLRDVIADLDPEQLVWGASEETVRGSEGRQRREVISRAEPNIWLRLYMDERRHLVEASAACLKAGVAERTIRLAEQQAEIVVGLIRRVLDDPQFGLNTEQRTLGRRLAANHMRALSVLSGGQEPS